MRTQPPDTIFSARHVSAAYLNLFLTLSLPCELQTALFEFNTSEPFAAAF